MSRYSDEKLTNIVNSILKYVNRPNKRIKNSYIVDTTSVACNINYTKKYVSPEELDKLKLKWGYSTTKGEYIGFKVTVVLNEKTLIPVAIFIHSGAPHDSTLFEPILEELKRRRIIKEKDEIL